jgi:hypothetical protein
LYFGHWDLFVICLLIIGFFCFCGRTSEPRPFSVQPPETAEDFLQTADRIENDYCEASTCRVGDFRLSPLKRGISGTGQLNSKQQARNPKQTRMIQIRIPQTKEYTASVHDGSFL